MWSALITFQDLDGDDVMILDGLNTIFVWIGANANASEKKHANTTAKVDGLSCLVFLVQMHLNLQPSFSCSVARTMQVEYT